MIRPVPKVFQRKDCRTCGGIIIINHKVNRLYRLSCRCSIDPVRRRKVKSFQYAGDGGTTLSWAVATIGDSYSIDYESL